MKRVFRIIYCLCFISWLTGCASFLTNEKYTSGADRKVSPKPAATTQISPELLIEELELIKSQLLKIHPQPFARLSKQAFEEQFELLKATINYPMSRAEFYLRVAPLLASLKDIHSFVHMPKDHYGDFQHRDEKLLPLALIIQDDKALVAADLSDKPAIAAGAEILSINQAPINFLLNVMRALTTRETATGQSRKIQMNFAWLLAAMGYASDTYLVEYLWHGEHFEVELAGLEMRLKKDSSSISYYGFSQLRDDTALLWLNDFNEKPEVFNDYLDKQFSKMKQNGNKNLVLDLRYNSGGSTENLKNLLSRIIDKPVYWAASGLIKVSKPLKKHHRKKTKKRRKDKYNWALQWLPLEWTDSLQHSIWWANPGDTISLDLKLVEPYENNKPERVWVLTNGFCYSACSFFIASVNQYNLGTILGEKPGSLADFQFAYPVNFTLPHSRLVVTFPTMRLDFVESELEDLTMPHETIIRTQRDIEMRYDPVMMRALQQAENQ